MARRTAAELRQLAEAGRSQAPMASPDIAPALQKRASEYDRQADGVEALQEVMAASLLGSI